MKRILLVVVCFFGLLFFPAYAETADSGDFSVQTIAETFAALDRENKYAEQLVQSEMNVLPMGMRKTINNNEFAIAVSNIRFHTNYAELTMFARMKISQRPEPIYFAASGVRFSYEGGFTGDASLSMLGDVDIRINDHTTLRLRGGNFNTQTGTVSEGRKTSLTVDCSGFKELEVEASVIFSESFIQKVSESGAVLPDPVSADFSIVVNDWNNLFLQINLPPFQIKGLDGFIFTLAEVIFDFSDYQNPDPSFFPSGYAGRYMAGGAPDLWRGFCAGELKVTLPKDFSKNGEPASFSARNFIIDDNGVSGWFVAENILPIEVGSASDWAFSINKFFLEMEAHKIKSGGFEGIIGLPVGDDVLLEYKAQIMGNNNYQLAVALSDTLPFDMFMGKATLLPNSSVTIQMVNGRFKPEANLNGFLTIRASLTGNDPNDSSAGTINMQNIEFQSLRFRTEAPYVSVDYMGYKGEIKLFNLPVSISNIRLQTGSDQLDLGFNLNLNLDDKFLSASSGLNISSKYSVTGGRGKWKYQGIKIDEVSLKNCEIAGVLALSGSLKIMTNDPDYGNGFSGEIELKFKKIVEGCSVRVAAAFGSKEDFKYWFVDGEATFPTPIPVVGVLGINGFGGGLSMKMKRVLNAGLGKSKTGCGFVPDESMGFGLKAAVFFKTIRGNAVHGDASFEIRFNDSGGFDFIGFYGHAEIAASVNVSVPSGISSIFKEYVVKENQFTSGIASKILELNNAKRYNPTEAAKQSTNAEEKVTALSIGATLGILYSVEERTLHATSDFYVNAAGGAIRGTASNHRAGWVVLHISPQKWYVFLGTPSDRIGLQIGIPGVATVKADSYFMLGDDIPGSPPPPHEVTDYLSGKGERYDYMRDLNALQSGTGIAFGSSVGFNTGDLTFLVLYARFKALIGFDLMIKDYGNAQCKGHNGPIGINGWYANGQTYAYLDGELGVKVNLRLIKGRFPIISAGCAALLQAKLPNPTWFGGSMGVNFKILGGMVKGNMRFKFSFGDECEIIHPGTSPLEVSMINDVSPANNASGVDVFTAPQVALSNPANTSFETNDENGAKKVYQIFLDRFTVKDGNTVLPGEIKWNSDNTTATFYSHEVLPPKKRLDLEVSVGFKELVNGQWRVVTTSGQNAEETRTVSFTTGEAPDYIPIHNIAYAYPMINQQRYYVDESTSGYVQLNQGQDYLFPPAGWTYNVYIDRAGKSEKGSFSYDTANKRLKYTLPSLTRGQEYDIAFHSVSSAGTGTSAPQEKETVLLNVDENQVVQTGTAAGQVIRDNEGKKILDYHFSASTYKTFADKINNVKKGQTAVELEGPYIVGLGLMYSGISEGFGEDEIFGTAGTLNKPMIQATATLTDTHYKENIYPLIYTGYPPSGLQLNRAGDAIGIPPVYAFGKWMEAGKFPVRYEATKYYYHDFLELQTKVVNAGLKTHPLYNASFFPDVVSGKYPALLQYILPGGENGSKAVFEYEINKK